MDLEILSKNTDHFFLIVVAILIFFMQVIIVIIMIPSDWMETLSDISIKWKIAKYERSSLLKKSFSSQCGFAFLEAGSVRYDDLI